MLPSFVWPSVSAVLVVSLVLFVLRNWILAKIKAAVQHDYQVRIEAIKASIQEQTSKSLLAFKNEMEQRDSVRSYARDLAAHSQRTVMERRLEAIQRLWNGLLSLNEDLPGAIRYTDILTREEYAARKFGKIGQRVLADLDMDSIEELSAKHGQLSGDPGDRTHREINYSVERVRPLVGAYIWFVFSTYRTLVFRVLFLLYRAKEDDSVDLWYEDPYLRGYLGGVFDRDELEEFDGVRLGRFAWIQSKLEAKIILGMGEDHVW